MGEVVTFHGGGFEADFERFQTVVVVVEQRQSVYLSSKYLLLVQGRWLETISGEAILGRFASCEEVDGVWEVLFSARILLRVSIKSASRRMLSAG